MAIFPPTRRPTVDLVVFGDEPVDMVPIARRTLRERFGVDPGVRRIEPVDYYADLVAPAGFDEPTYYPATELLDPTKEASEADREIGLVADPLILDEQPRIFGVALVGESPAVITSDPLTDGGDRFETRVEKQVTKQLGHLFGIETTHAGCVFEETPTLYDLDESPPTFCESCHARLTDPTTSPKPADWFVRDTRVYREVTGDDSRDGPAKGVEEPVAIRDEKSETVVTDDRTAVGGEASGRQQSATGDRGRSAAGQSANHGTGLPAGLRRPVHGLYRYARVWGLILCFAAFTILGLLIELELYARLTGETPSTGVTWGMLVGAVGIGYYGQRTVRRWVGRGRARLTRS
ncbi:putative Zn-dependent protease [Halovivax ruber XH-70]|uniref:Putative Zn-dependent protease n=1 Tax=Halovivax ruber (strain DSM 18193 / JCM 13892 / XH-70) TaxID=797302 RepID=L0IGE1_HALRX|nr:Zn-dependent protease [Halovivax ruber]AGB17057.1 putative Zn-dependent protease [Halovivax ruber XH-70]